LAWLSLVPGETIEAWNDPEFEAYFRDSYRFGAPPPTSLSMESHQPEAMRAWCRWWWTAFHNGIVEHPLMETLRVHIARLSDCDY
jgi:hypothetical protein